MPGSLLTYSGRKPVGLGGKAKWTGNLVWSRSTFFVLFALLVLGTTSMQAEWEGMETLGNCQTSPSPVRAAVNLYERRQLVHGGNGHRDKQKVSGMFLPAYKNILSFHVWKMESWLLKPKDRLELPSVQLQFCISGNNGHTQVDRQSELVKQTIFLSQPTESDGISI